MIDKIISGGQTGVDRAALDAALTLDIACGGWCPRMRKAEDGAISSQYPLSETFLEDYAQRTEWNVRDSDGTLIIINGDGSQGTKLTIEISEKLNKPICIVSVDDAAWTEKARGWLKEKDLRTLNIAGPRESESPGIYRRCLPMLQKLFAEFLP